MTNDDLIRAVRAYAQANYDEGGWDILVECWDDEDVLKACGLIADPLLGRHQEGPVKSIAEGIARIGTHLRTSDEYRTDIQRA